MNRSDNPPKRNYINRTIVLLHSSAPLATDPALLSVHFSKMNLNINGKYCQYIPEQIIFLDNFLFNNYNIINNILDVILLPLFYVFSFVVCYLCIFLTFLCCLCNCPYGLQGI
jgi:hypothetical protein